MRIVDLIMLLLSILNLVAALATLTTRER